MDEEGRTVRGTVDDEEGEMRRRGARECEEALMEALRRDEDMREWQRGTRVI